MEQQLRIVYDRQREGDSPGRRCWDTSLYILRAHTCTGNARVCARVSVKCGRVSACKSIVVATANPRATEWRVKALPKPPGMTENGDEKKRESARYRGRRREKGGREREKPNGIFGKWNMEIKGFSLRATHGQQITDLFGDRVYIEVRRWISQNCYYHRLPWMLWW